MACVKIVCLQTGSSRAPHLETYLFFKISGYCAKRRSPSLTSNFSRVSMKNNACAVFQAKMFAQKWEVLRGFEACPRLHKDLLNFPWAVPKTAQWDPAVIFARQNWHRQHKCLMLCLCVVLQPQSSSIVRSCTVLLASSIRPSMSPGSPPKRCLHKAPLI